jgi:cysteine-rich repeat protein
MKNLVLGSLIIMASGAAGCTVSSSTAFCGDGILDTGEASDDGNNVSGDGCSATCDLEATPHTTHATWQLKDIDGTNAGCPAGFDTAIVVSWKLDGSGNPIGTCAPGGTPSGTCYLDIFNCAAGSGTTGPISAGDFMTFVAVTNASGSDVYAETLSDVVNLTTANGTFPNDPGLTDGTIYKNGGYFEASWTLIGATSGNTLTCATAGSGGVSVLSTVTGGTQAADDVFKCTDHFGITGGLLEGSYTVSVSALDTSSPGLALGTPTNKANQIIQGPHTARCSPRADCVTDLGMLTLSVDGL